LTVLNPPFAIRIYYIFIPSAFLKFLVGAKQSNMPMTRNSNPFV